MSNNMQSADTPRPIDSDRIFNPSQFLCGNMIIHRERVFYVTPFGKVPRITVIECVIGLCLTIMLVLVQLPYENIGEYPVPTIVFRGRPHTFHAFVLLVLAAFMTATRAINAPANSSGKFESFCVLLSVVSISSAFLVFLFSFLCSVIPCH